jgi:hypothetical protein
MKILTLQYLFMISCYDNFAHVSNHVMAICMFEFIYSVLKICEFIRGNLLWKFFMFMFTHFVLIICEIIKSKLVSWNIFFVNCVLFDIHVTFQILHFCFIWSFCKRILFFAFSLLSYIYMIFNFEKTFLFCIFFMISQHNFILYCVVWYYLAW